jgi:serine/threonine protein kinase
MDHPFIVKLYDVINTDLHIFFVMEYLERGSLLDYPSTYGLLSEVEARRYFWQIQATLDYLHDVRKIAHRDLKPENSLLDRHHNLRLIDFGLSNSFSDEIPDFLSICGSPAYAAPELLNGQRYTKAVDIWSAGVVLYSFVTGALPFGDPVPAKMLTKIAYSDPLCPDFISPPLIDFLRKLFQRDAKRRITIQGIKAHPWFSRNEYSHFWRLQFGEWQDRDRINQLLAMGVDIKPLFNSKVLGEYNELTKLASMIRRKALTDRMRNLMMNLTDYRQAALARESVVKLMRMKGKNKGQLKGKSPLDR